MSLKPICETPADLKKYTFKEQKGKLLKAIKKLAKKHDTPTTAAPFYLCTEQKFPDKDKAFFLVFGKMEKWKKYAKDNAPKEPALRGACYVSYDEQAKCLVLNLMPVAGKLKSKGDLIGRAMKVVVNPSRCRVEIAKGDFSDEWLDKLAEATEKMEDVPDDVVGDMMEDQVEEMHGLVDKAKASGKLSPEEVQKIDAISQDIEDLENLLEKMAASDDVEEVKTLDKEIRTLFAKYIGAK